MGTKQRIWQDSETETDFLNFGYLVDLVADLATNREISPSTIGIYGDWGSGKSSLMRMVQSKIEGGKDKKVICVRFNGWLFEGYEDAKTSLCGTILDEIRHNEKVLPAIKSRATKLLKKIDVIKLLGKGVRFVLDGILTGGFGTLTELTISSIMKSLRESASTITADQVEELLNKFRAEENAREEIKSFQSDFAKLIVDSKIDQLVVFIDELDRCSPETVLDVFEAMRLFLFAKGTSFIIGADERLIQYAIKTKYKEVSGNNLDIGKEYLEKVIQYPISIPPLTQSEVHQYISCLLLKPAIEETYFSTVLTAVHSLAPDQELTLDLLSSYDKDLEGECKNELALSKQISSVLASSINGNPRQCKRFLNTLFMRKQLAESRDVDLDINIQAKLLLAEYFKLDFFKTVTNPINSNYFKSFEAGLVLQDGNPFARFIGDKWISQWVQNDPKLSDLNFENYLYFATKAGRYQQSMVDFLSPSARCCYEYLIDRTATHRIEALSMVKSISEGECSIIASSVFNVLSSDTSMKTEILRSYVDFCFEAGLHDEAVKKLQEIPAANYPGEAVAQLMPFLNKIPEVSRKSIEEYLGKEERLKTAFNRFSTLASKLPKKNNGNI